MLCVTQIFTVSGKVVLQLFLQQLWQLWLKTVYFLCFRLSHDVVRFCLFYWRLLGVLFHLIFKLCLLFQLHACTPASSYEQYILNSQTIFAVQHPVKIFVKNLGYRFYAVSRLRKLFPLYELCADSFSIGLNLCWIECFNRICKKTFRTYLCQNIFINSLLSWTITRKLGYF